MWAGRAQSVYWLATAWRVRGSNPGGGEIFNTISYTIRTGLFPGVRRTECSFDHPPTSKAEVKERVELVYPYFPCGLSWLVGWNLAYIWIIFQVIITLQWSVLKSRIPEKSKTLLRAIHDEVILSIYDFQLRRSVLKTAFMLSLLYIYWWQWCKTEVGYKIRFLTILPKLWYIASAKFVAERSSFVSKRWNTITTATNLKMIAA